MKRLLLFLLFVVFTTNGWGAGSFNGSVPSNCTAYISSYNPGSGWTCDDWNSNYWGDCSACDQVDYYMAYPNQIGSGTSILISDCVTCKDGSAPFVNSTNLQGYGPGCENLSIRQCNNRCGINGTPCSSDSDCSGSTPVCNASGCCEAQCSTNSDCGSVSVSSMSNGREQVTTPTCESGTCKDKITYRCAANYYKSGQNTIFPANITCTACPSPGHSSAGSTSASDCCISANQTGSDAKGTFKYKTGCCYQ